MRSGIDGHERRSHRRYEIETEVHYAIASERQPLHYGTGRMVNLSSGGLLFETQEKLSVGVEVQVFLTWPSRTRNQQPFRVCIEGEVVRVKNKRVAVKILSYDYRLHCDEPAERQAEESKTH